jgi:hypothetical protein
VSFISAKPINLIWGALSGEYEQAFRPGQTLGVSAATFGVGGVRVFGSNAKFRHYFDGEEFSGFSIAGQGGVAGLTVSDNYGMGGERETAFGVTAGAELGYMWRLGDDRRWAIQLQTGAQRVFPLADFGADIWFVMPTGGIAVGYGL